MSHHPKGVQIARKHGHLSIQGSNRIPGPPAGSLVIADGNQVHFRPDDRQHNRGTEASIPNGPDGMSYRVTVRSNGKLDVSPASKG